MEAKASVIDVHSTPKKLRILVDSIRQMKPIDALDVLMYSPKKSAQILYKVIKSALDNAKATLQLEPHLLKFKLLKVDQGHSLKRYNPGGRGMVKPYRKKYAHISVVLKATEKQEKKKVITKEKTELKIDQKPSIRRKVVKNTKKDGTKS